MTVKLHSLGIWILLAGGVTATSAQLWRLGLELSGPSPLAETYLPAEPISQPYSGPDRRLDDLILAAPFGTFRRDPVSGWTDAATTDQLTLHAVRLSQVKSDSTATLSISGGAMDIYRVGDDIGGLGTLRHIEARRVIVEISGEDRLVEFPVPERRSPLPPIYAAISAEYSGGATASQAIAQSASETATRAIRSQMDANPQVLIESFGFEAAGDGYIVGPNTPPVLRAAGLEPGDRVIKVNGSQVGDAASDRLLFEEAVASGRARVEILRDGQTLVLSFPLN